MRLNKSRNPKQKKIKKKQKQKNKKKNKKKNKIRAASLKRRNLIIVIIVRVRGNYANQHYE